MSYNLDELHKRIDAVRLVLPLYVFLWAVSSILLPLSNYFVSGEFGTLAPVDDTAPMVAKDWIEAGISFGYLLFFLLSIVVVLRAFRESNRKTHELRAESLSYTPRDCVLWFCIPIFNLYKPLKVVEEFFTVSFSRELEKAEKIALQAWWGTWIATVMLDGFITRIHFGMGSLGKETDIGTKESYLFGAETLSVLFAAASAYYLIQVLNIVYRNLQTLPPSKKKEPGPIYAKRRRREDGKDPSSELLF